MYIVDDEVLGEWRELQPSETKNLDDQLETNLPARIILLWNVTVGMSVI